MRELLTKEKYKKAKKIQKDLERLDEMDQKQVKYYGKLIERIVDYECYMIDQEKKR